MLLNACYCHMTITKRIVSIVAMAAGIFGNLELLDDNDEQSMQVGDVFSRQRNENVSIT